LLKSSGFAEKMMRSVEGGLKRTPTPDQFELYATKAHFPNDRAMAVIGYKPETSIERGLQMSAGWLRHLGLA